MGTQKVREQREGLGNGVPRPQGRHVERGERNRRTGLRTRNRKKEQRQLKGQKGEKRPEAQKTRAKSCGRHLTWRYLGEPKNLQKQTNPQQNPVVGMPTGTRKKRKLEETRIPPAQNRGGHFRRGKRPRLKTPWRRGGTKSTAPARPKKRKLRILTTPVARLAKGEGRNKGDNNRGFSVDGEKNCG